MIVFASREFYQVLELCVNQDISLHIVKPFTEVSALQRQQWVLQVFALALTLVCMCVFVTTNYVHTDHFCA